MGLKKKSKSRIKQDIRSKLGAMVHLISESDKLKPTYFFILFFIFFTIFFP